MARRREPSSRVRGARRGGAHALGGGCENEEAPRTARAAGAALAARPGLLLRARGRDGVARPESLRRPQPRTRGRPRRGKGASVSDAGSRVALRPRWRATARSGAATARSARAGASPIATQSAASSGLTASIEPRTSCACSAESLRGCPRTRFRRANEAGRAEGAHQRDQTDRDRGRGGAERRLRRSPREQAER
jgi:hypothetical protein